MAVSSKLYSQTVRNLFAKNIDYLVDDVKVALLGESYVPDQDAHDFFDDVSASEIAGTGYTAGGLSLTGKTSVYDAVTNTVKLDADDVIWPGSTLTAYYAVFYIETAGLPGTDPLLCYWDFGIGVSSVAAPFTLTIAAAGLVTAVVS